MSWTLDTVLPIIAMLVVIGLYLKEEDEFVRNVLVEAMLWGAA